MSQIKDGIFIKCPACGSTAQVEMVWGSCSDGRYSRLERDYECGCSCNFTVFFEATEFAINKN